LSLRSVGVARVSGPNIKPCCSVCVCRFLPAVWGC
jgi:hypothetical protein